MKQTLRMKDLKIQMLAGNKFEFFFCSQIRGDYNFQFAKDPWMCYPKKKLGATY